MVKFSAANTKLKKLYKVAALAKWLAGGKKIYSFDLLSGHSCPFADRCLSKAIETPEGRRIQDGPNTEFRCFSASQEVVYTNVYKLRKANFEALRSCGTSKEMVELLQSALPKNAGIVRWHVAGDIFNRNYMSAIIQIAINNPGTLFYLYTKALPLWIERIELINSIPNLVMTASYGGKFDNLIAENNLRYSLVVADENEASDFNLPVDDDDSHAAIPDNRNESFALVIHGTQPAKPKVKKPKKKSLVARFVSAMGLK